MRRFTTAVSILCFLVVSTLESGICCLCVAAGCESDAVVPDEPEEANCRYCCSTQDVYAESKCPPAQPQAQPVRFDSLKCFRQSTNRCTCECILPCLTAVPREGRDKTFANLDGSSVSLHSAIRESTTNSFLKLSCPQGVHPIISTTVLRC